MGFSVIFLAISCVAVLLEAAALGDSKSENRHSPTHIARSTIRDNSSLKKMQESLRNAHVNLQSNQIDGSVTRDQVQIHPKYHSQDIPTSTLSDRGNREDRLLFQSTTRDSFPTTTISSVASGNLNTNGELSHQKQHMNRQVQGNSESQERFMADGQSVNPQRFFDNNRQNSEGQQFFNSRQQSPVVQQQHFSRRQQSQQHIFPERQSSPSEQQFYNLRQQAQQQQFNDPRNHQGQQSNLQPQQPFNAGQPSFEQHQKFNNAGQQSYEHQQQLFIPGQQQRVYSNMQTMDIMGQNINLNNQFQGLSIHQSQIRSERPLILSQNILTQMHSKGVRKDVQLSPFDNREHGYPVSHGSSVVVSGLKNLPVLPAVVYNAGPVPATHAIAYGRDGYYKGTASLNQQMRTPYVRYVYSHIL